MYLERNDYYVSQFMLLRILTEQKLCQSGVERRVPSFGGVVASIAVVACKRPQCVEFV